MSNHTEIERKIAAFDKKVIGIFNKAENFFELIFFPIAGALYGAAVWMIIALRGEGNWNFWPGLIVGAVLGLVFALLNIIAKKKLGDELPLSLVLLVAGLVVLGVLYGLNFLM